MLAALSLILASSMAAAERKEKEPNRKAAQAAKKKDSREQDQTSKSETKDWPRRFWFFATLASGFDSNINHDEASINSVGFVPSFGIHFQNDVEKPSFEIEYETALHRYTNTDKWNRVSHRLSTSYRKRFNKRWYTRTTGDITLKGSSEDRELNNQYSLGQQLEYRPLSNIRLIGFASYRIKRDPLDSRSNAIDPYIGGKFVQSLAGNRQWELSYRYDKNRSWDAKNRYIRWAYEAAFQTPIIDRRNRLTVDVTYKPRLYARTVKVSGVRVPRHDRRWIFETSFERSLRQDLQMDVFYSYETRNSNDPDKRFKSHQAGIAFTYKW